MLTAKDRALQVCELLIREQWGIDDGEPTPDGHIEMRWQELAEMLTPHFEAHAAEVQVRLAALQDAVRHAAESDEFDDLEPDDGLHQNSVRRYLRDAADV